MYFDNIVFFDWLVELAQPKSTVAVSVNVSTLYFPLNIFSPFTTNRYQTISLFLFKDLAYFALCDIIFSINNIFFHVPSHVRGCLHVKFHPRMKLVPEWNHSCIWWNVSYCLHVFAKMKFHPGMNSCLSKRQGWNFIPGWTKEKKTCKHFAPWWNFKMRMFFLLFLTYVFKYAFQN